MENTQIRSSAAIAFSDAIVAAMAELKNVPKTANNPYFKSKYAPLDAIVDATRPVLAKHGLAVMQAPLFMDGTAGVETTIIHKGGHVFSTTLLLPLKDLSPQGVGGAITYARRYSLAAVLGLATEEDMDGNEHLGKSAEAPRPAIAKVMDSGNSAPRPAGQSTATWRDIEITDLKIAAQSKEGAARKWTLYSVTFNGSSEAMTFDKNIYDKAKELALVKVDANVCPSKKDPSKWELVAIQKTEGSKQNLTIDEKA